MERLTERNPLWIDDELWERACEPDCEEIDAVYRKLKDYEDAEEQGLLLRLPCKVGDAVYQITNGFISEYEITSAVIYPYNILFKWVCTKGIYKDLLGFNDFEIGKTVFLTREEAEVKLKEMEGEYGE